MIICDEKSIYTLLKTVNDYNLLSLYMSYLLDLAIALEQEEKQAHNPQNTKNIIKSIFKSQLYSCKNILNNGSKIIFFLDPTKDTYQRSTLWTFDLAGLNFTLSINFYNHGTDDLIRASTERMRIQSSILIRLINLLITPSYSYYIDTQSGALSLVYTCSWGSFIQISNRKQKMMELINKTFCNIRTYHQLTIFIQPQFLQNITFPEQKDPHIAINKFRFFLQQTISYNNKIRACLGDILKIKRMNDKQVLQNLPIFENLYLQNVVAYQQSMMGLQNLKSYVLDEKTFVDEQKQIRKNTLGFTTHSENQRIVFGLYQIKEAQPKDQSKKQEEWVKLAEQVGAHSCISKKFFRYILVETIYKGANQGKDIKYPEEKNYLICKDCKKDSIPSVNSFKNQLKAIQYMKDKKSPFIARYYLKLMQKWDESDTIYLKTYEKNLYTLITQNKFLTVKTKIDISYKIAKGFCFLYSNKMNHRDFKPQNIVIDRKLTPKIIDFGSCSSHYGTKNFKAFNQMLLTTPIWNNSLMTNDFPDKVNHLLRTKFIKSEHYNQHPLFDVYAFGKVLCFIFFYDIRPPPPHLFKGDPYFQILQHLIFLINLCTNPDPDDRPGFGQLTAFLGSLRKLLKIPFVEGSQSEINELNERS